MPPFVALFAAIIGALAAAAGAWLVRGSTAVPAAVWALVAWLALAAEMAIRMEGGLAEPAPAAGMRLLVAALSLCPTLSLLGAKRPQHGVWQFIVATLAFVLALPAASAALMRPGSLPAVHPIESWLIVVIVLVGWLNFIGTRRGLAATLVALGQAVLLRPFLPFVDPERQTAQLLATPSTDGWAAMLVAAGSVLAAMQGWRGGRRQPVVGIDPLAAAVDPPFLALRETLGAAWSLRIAERFDAIAAARGWPCRLRFTGLEIDAAADDAAWRRDAQRGFLALVRRFVSPGWLSRHKPQPLTDRTSAVRVP